MLYNNPKANEAIISAIPNIAEILPIIQKTMYILINF